MRPTTARSLAALSLAAPVAILGCAGEGQPVISTPSRDRVSGSAIVAISDGDMAITMFDDGFLFGPDGSGAMRTDDLLTVIGLPLPEPGDREQRTRFGSARVSSSVIGPPRNLAVDAQGRFALVLSTRGHASRDAVSWEDLSPGGRLTLVDLRDSFGRGPRISATLDVGPAATTVALSRDGSLAVVLSGSEKVVQFISTDGTTLARVGEAALIGMPATGAQPTCVAISPDGATLGVTVVGANVVAFYEIVKGQGAYGLRPFGDPVRVGDFPYTGAFSPSGGHFFTTNLGWDRSQDRYLVSAPNTTVSMIRVAGADAEDPAHRVVATAGAGQNGEGIAVSPRGDLVAIGNLRRSFLRETDPAFTLGGTLQLLRVDETAGTLTSGPEVEGPAGPQGLSFDATGDHLLVTDFERGVVQIWRVDRSQDGPPALRYTGLRVGVGDGAHNVAIIP